MQFEKVNYALIVIFFVVVKGTS